MAKKSEQKEPTKLTLAQKMQSMSPGSAVFGPGIQTASHDIPVISTGVTQLDIALGVGGLPKGRIVEIYGAEASGKTTLTLHIIAEAQKAGLEAAFIDAEHALDVSYAKRIGVDTDALTVVQPDSGEHALELVDVAIKGGAGIIVVDSVAALTPQKELDGDMGDSHVGLQARMMSQAMRKLTGAVARSGCILVFINQTRQAIGGYGGQVTTGGNALKFYSSVRIQVLKGGELKLGTEVVGSTPELKVKKNKIAPPHRVATADLLFGAGFDRPTNVLSMATDLGIIEKSGSWFSYGDTRLGQGKQNAVETLRNDVEMLAEVGAKVLTEYRAGGYLP